MVYCTDLIVSSPLHFPLLFCPASLYPLHPCHVLLLLLLLSLLPFLVLLLRHHSSSSFTSSSSLHVTANVGRHDVSSQLYTCETKSVKKFRLYGIRNHDLWVAVHCRGCQLSYEPNGVSWSRFEFVIHP